MQSKFRIICQVENKEILRGQTKARGGSGINIQTLTRAAGVNQTSDEVCVWVQTVLFE